jgi:hypothetical protein
MKGWMSPSGKAHMFNPDQEHADNWHPSYRGKRGIHSAQDAGYVRFSSLPSKDGIPNHYINYSTKHPKGKMTALMALRHIKPGHGDRVVTNGMGVGPDKWKQGSPSEISRHLLER